MKLLIFNDSQSIEVQALYQEGDILRIRMIHITPGQLKDFFKDEFLTRKMILKEGNKEIAVYEGYTEFEYILEDCGGIFEVKLVQKGKDTSTRLAEVETIASEAKETAETNVLALHEAIADLTVLISMMNGTVEGGIDNV